MNQEKIGKFIAELRKEKNLTQEDIADKLGITSQSISKWERGVNSPDISFLNDLGKILGISVEELLQGEKNNNIKDKNKECEKHDEILINSIKFYEGKTKKKYKNIMMCAFVFFLLIICLLLFAYYCSNYNKIKIYTLGSVDNQLSISGRLIFNPTNNILLLSDIEYNDKYTGTNKEIKGKGLMIKIHSNNKTILEYGDTDFDDYTESKTINELLDELFINNIIDVQNEVKITQEDIKNLKITLFYIDDMNELKEIETQLILDEEFSNNTIFYQ